MGNEENAMDSSWTGMGWDRQGWDGRAVDWRIAGLWTVEVLNCGPAEVDNRPAGQLALEATVCESVQCLSVELWCRCKGDHELRGIAVLAGFHLPHLGA